MSRRAGLALLAAGSIVLLLALGTFAAPVPADDLGPGAALLGEKNDLPVVARHRVSVDQIAPHTPSAPAALVIILTVLVVVVPGSVRRRPQPVAVVPTGPGARACPPHRGPPVLLAG